MDPEKHLAILEMIHSVPEMPLGSSVIVDLIERRAVTIREPLLSFIKEQKPNCKIYDKMMMKLEDWERLKDEINLSGPIPMKEFYLVSTREDLNELDKRKHK